MRRVLPLAWFELRYQAWRFTFLAAVVCLALVPVALVSTGFGPRTDAVNGTLVVSESLALISLVSVFALPLLCVHAALRDDEHAMRGLVDAKPMARHVLLAVRGGSVLVLLLSILAVCTALLAILPVLSPPPGDRLVDFTVSPYARGFAFLVVPNALWCTALLFAVAAATRSTLATFVASVCVYAGYLVTALMVDSPLMAGTRPPTPELLRRVALLDPFGLSAVFEQTRYLMPAERNVFPIAFSGRLLHNRILVVLFALVCAAPVLRFDERVARRPLSQRGARFGYWWRRMWRGFPTDTSTVDRSSPPDARTAVARIAPQVSARGFSTWLRTARAVAAFESALLFKSWPVLLLLLVWVVVILIEADGQLRGGEYGTRVLASTAQLADAVPQALEMLGSMCALYFAAEVFSRESVTRFAGIRDATPAPSSALLAGKLLALLVVPLVLTLTGYGATVAVHLVSGGLPVEWEVLVAHSLVSLVPLVTTTMMAAALQQLVGHRWVALLVGLLVVLFAGQGAAMGAEHPLWRFGAAPGIAWSDLSGFGAGLRSWSAFQGTWAVGAVSLLLVAAGMWTRGEPQAFITRLRRAPVGVRQSLGAAGVFALLASVLIFVVSMVGMGWLTTVHRPWVSSRTAIMHRVEYERRYAHLRNVPQPSIVHVTMTAVLDPSRARAQIRAVLQLRNRTQAVIDTVFVAVPRAVSAVSFDHLGSGMRVVARDSLHGVYTLALGRSLLPDSAVSVPYVATIDGDGVRAAGNPDDIVANGTFLHASDVLPRFGFARERTLRDSVERTKQGLPVLVDSLLLPATRIDSVAAVVARRGREPAWFTADVTIETAPDQVAHGPGQLVAHDATAMRSRWRYRQNERTTPAFVITSGRYAVLRALARTAYGVVPVEVWYNPRHIEPARRLLDVTTRSVAQLSRSFGRYPHPVLRVVEVSSAHRFGAYAMPGTIYLTETRGMLSDARGGTVDLLLRRIGHEVAHEWWGHAVDPLDVVGRLLLVETMAKYAEQLLLTEAQGEAVVHDMLTYDEDRYFRARNPRQPALIDMTDDDALFYGKGALAMHAMRHLLGDSVVVGVARDVIAAHAGPHGVATARDFVARLLTVAPDEPTRALVREWFTERVVYDASLDSASLREVEGGTRVSARFRVYRHTFASTSGGGAEHVTALDRVEVPVGVRNARGEWQVMRVRAMRGLVTLDTTVPWPATWVEIDPERTLLERDRGNNGDGVKR